MNFGMLVLVIFVAVAMFVVLFGLLWVSFTALWYLCGVGMRWLRSQPSPWHNPNPDWIEMPCALALLAAAVLIIVMLFASPTEVHRNPRMRGVRIEFREPSAWRALVEDPGCSDRYAHITIVHVAADCRRTSTEATEYSREWRGTPNGEPDRTVRWATNGSDRAVVATSYGNFLFLPDLLPIPPNVPYAAIEAYLQGHPAKVVLQLLQATGQPLRAP